MPIERQKSMRQLLAFLLRQTAPACIHGTEAQGLQISAGEERCEVASAILETVQRLGLVHRHGNQLTARPEARSFLRRAIAEEEETRFASQHREEVRHEMLVEGVRQPVLRNAAESALSQLARLKDRAGQPFLPVEALDAGEKLSADFERAHLQPSITMNWQPSLSQKTKGERGGKVELTESAMAARDRVSAAIEAMGPELAGVALDICCFGKGLELVERERGWPVRSAKLMLRTALLALARHYAPPATRRRSHHWGEEGYRPDL